VRLQFTPSAQRDLVRLREFIAEHNPVAARRISDELRKSIRSLIVRPALGYPIDELPGVREWVARDYVVRYLVLDEVLTVLRVWHGKEMRY
jgi:addiction module RelE/StbE family toxin